MNISLLSLRKLKYRYLPALVGKQITIPSITNVAAPVLAALSTFFRGPFKMKGSLEELSRPMWKYGFLDLTFETGDALLGPADKINRAVIRELGYSPRPPHCDSELSERSCLEVLIESMIDRGCFLRLFLDSKWSKDFMGRFMETASQQPRGPEWDSAVDAAALALKSRMPSWFPVDFTIEDACLTNSDAIWLARHEYL